MASIVVAGDTSGSVTLSAPAVAGSTVLTLPSVSGTVLTSASSQVNGPAFSAYASANQTGLTSATYVKAAFNTKVFDTNSNYDNTTNYRFTPTVAGYYQVNVSFLMSAAVTFNGQANIYKNGSLYNGSSYSSALSATLIIAASSLVYLNGSTDYIEGYAFASTSSGTWTISGNQALTYFNAAMVRSA